MCILRDSFDVCRSQSVPGLSFGPEIVNPSIAVPTESSAWNLGASLG